MTTPTVAPVPLAPTITDRVWLGWFVRVRDILLNRSGVGVDTDDDVITDSTTKGPVMKSPNGHYWRAAISNIGVVTWTDLGTTKP